MNDFSQRDVHADMGSRTVAFGTDGYGSELSGVGGVPSPDLSAALSSNSLALPSFDSLAVLSLDSVAVSSLDALTVLSLDPLAIVALVLLTAGPLGVLAPKLPGSMLSLAGVYLYWGSTGFTEPSIALLVLLTAAGLFALGGKLFGSVAAARIGGTSTTSAVVASVVGGILFAFGGPGLALLGVLVTIFVLEYRRSQQLRTASVAALSVVLGSLASKAIRLVLTGAIWVVMVAFVVF